MNQKIRNGNTKVNSTERVGAFTIVRLTEEGTGLEAKGITRKARFDRENKELAFSIAQGRALKALYLKKQGLPVYHPFMT